MLFMPSQSPEAFSLIQLHAFPTASFTLSQFFTTAVPTATVPAMTAAASRPCGPRLAATLAMPPPTVPRMPAAFVPTVVTALPASPRAFAAVFAPTAAPFALVPTPPSTGMIFAAPLAPAAAFDAPPRKLFAADAAPLSHCHMFERKPPELPLPPRSMLPKSFVSNCANIPFPLKAFFSAVLMASVRVWPKSVPTTSSTAVSPLASALAQSPLMAATTVLVAAATVSLAPSFM